MKKTWLIIGLLGIYMSIYADTHRMWIFLSDKGENIQKRLSKPTAFLSKASLALKKEKGITLNEQDLPVWQSYVGALGNYDCKVLSTSRWLNAVAVDIPENCLEEVQDLCFVKDIKPVHKFKVAREGVETEVQGAKYVKMNASVAGDAFNYGDAREQAEMLNVPAMHKKGITGRGVRIAVFDAGFDGVDTIDVFDSLWIQKRVIAWYDFVDNDKTLFRNDNHGTNVLSCIAANQPGEMVGIAPHVSVVLARTEDSGSETNREEHNWVRAMEWADSIGVDIIHSSLGYTNFDDKVSSYKYEDMDGNTAISSRAADIAASRGIVVTVSAGNEGDGPWKYIAAPSDADSVLCVGAVSKNGKRASFSSMGPSADGQVKPDVMAIGKGTTVAAPGNYITTSNGTSFSGPIMGGFMALLKQAHPRRKNMELIQATRLSGDQYNFPDAEYGYGIPNVMTADSLLKNVKDLASVKMPGTEKPKRGEKPKPVEVAKKLEMTKNPKTGVGVEGDKLVVKSAAFILKAEIRQGDMRVILPKTAYKINEKDATFDIKNLVKGEHYLYIKTDSYEEYIKFDKK